MPRNVHIAEAGVRTKAIRPTSIRSRNFSALLKVNFHSLSVESEQQTRKINIIHELGISNRKFRSLWSEQIYSQRLLEPLGDGNPSNSNQYPRSELNVQTCRFMSREIDFWSWCWSERVQNTIGPLKHFPIEIRFELFCINSHECFVDRKAWVWFKGISEWVCQFCFWCLLVFVSEVW